MSRFEYRLRRKLLIIYGNNPESLLRAFHYLDNENVQGKRTTRDRLKWALSLNKNDDTKFRRIVEQIVTDTKTPKSDRVFQKKIINTCKFIEKRDNRDEIKIYNTSHTNTQSALIGLLSSFDLDPNNSFCRIKKVFQKLAPSVDFEDIASKLRMFKIKNKLFDNVIKITLTGIELGAEVVRIIKQWWNGEIPGRQCFKNIFYTVATMAASIGGGFGSAALGALVGEGPLGTIVGRIIEAICTGIVGSLSHRLARRTTQKIFTIPKNDAVQNAYEYFGVGMNASKAALNRRYKRLCLETHPDKGGCHEDFLELQLQMAVIKLARNDQY